MKDNLIGPAWRAKTPPCSQPSFHTKQIVYILILCIRYPGQPHTGTLTIPRVAVGTKLQEEASNGDQTDVFIFVTTQ